MERELQELNTFVTTKIAPSKIHGVGVFALRDIKKGEYVYANIISRLYELPYEKFDLLRPGVKDLLLERWPQIVNGSKFMFPDTQIQAFMNHSDNPNYDAVNDVALTDISKGDEITEDYRKIEGYEKVFKWLCN